MFKHLLLATDGSSTSETAIHKALQFAQSIQATVTGITVTPEYHMLGYHTKILPGARENHAKESMGHASQVLAVIENAARALGVTCDTMHVVNDHPYQAIVEAAKEKNCDLITMASHGRKGLQSLIIGSETQKVLAHSTVPVLIFR